MCQEASVQRASRLPSNVPGTRVALDRVVGSGDTPLGRVVPRRVAGAVADALADTRVVLVVGARQCGKSTLVRVVAQHRTAEWRNLDATVTRQAAAADPSGFVAFPELMVIDEIQRAPELLLAIKEEVDTDPQPGRYLLTGSARVLGLRVLPDVLPGRTETIELWPFSQGEIDGVEDGFVDAVFADGGAPTLASSVSRREYAERIVRGGFPEAVARTNPNRRERFFDSYVGDLVARVAGRSERRPVAGSPWASPLSS